MKNVRPNARKYEYKGLPRTREELRQIWKDGKNEKLFLELKGKKIFTFGQFLEVTKC